MGLLTSAAKTAGKNLLDEPEEFIDAYHGSPHLFDKFDSSKIGTGEGAQAYSHGLYAAQREGVARDYRDRLTDDKATFKHPELGDLGFQGTRYHFIDFLENKGFSKSVANHAADQFSVGILDGDDLDHFENFLKKNSAKDLSMTPEEHSALLAGIPEAQKFKVERPKGHLYKVKIKTGEQNLLDWDTPLKDQPKPIQDKVLKIYSDNYSPEQRAEDQNLLDQLMTKEEQAALPESNPRLELTGAQVHDDLVQYHNRENSKKVTELNEKMSDIAKQVNEISIGHLKYRPGFEEQGKELSKQYYALMDERSALPKSGQPAAAQNLLDAGIPGVKYDDALSRGKEKRTKNYVIYSDELIDIAKRYGIPVATVSTIAKASGVTGLIAAGLTPEDAQAGVLSSGEVTKSKTTAKDKAVAVGETLLDAGQAMIAPIAAAPHALIPALTSDRPTAQIEQGYQNLLQQMDYEPSTQLGQEYSQAAQQFMGDAFNAAAQSAPGQAIKQVVEPINLLIQQAPERARLVGRSLLDMSPF